MYQHHGCSGCCENPVSDAQAEEALDSEAGQEAERNVVFKHDKDGLSIYITIYNTNNNANEGSEAGLKQKAEGGGQIAGKDGRNANQGGQITGACGQNANQEGEITASGCDLSEEDPEEECGGCGC